ncbi:acyltransferase family protein [Lacticaseibacillus parakribbianus]|uniref:acyltransferase family protein n=1 Tax=Lacticaseibacillus parakribbianus TaxID=2970927 RepID=UPI0021CB4D42|nr:acyltransferase family protein [Lacticaseibacillus parakribbianus]
MDLILLAIGALFVLSWRWAPDTQDRDYLDHRTTMTINGFFLFLVFFSHFATYLPVQTQLFRLSGIWLHIQRQVIVTPFLFFSGYGIMTQLIRRGHRYVDSFPVRRFFFVWFRFFVAVSLFWLVAEIMHVSYPLSRIALAYTGVVSIGNSNWYIFAVLVLYILTYVAFKLFGRRQQVALAVMGLLLVGYTVVAYQHLVPAFYNTIFCYYAGMLFAVHKDRITAAVAGSWPRYLLAGVLVAAMFAASYLLVSRTQAGWRVLWYELMSVSFALGVTWFAMRVRVVNPLLAYMGGGAMFSLYMLQRLPMIVGSKLGLSAQPIPYFLIVVVSTFAISWVFEYVVNAVLQVLIHKQTAMPGVAEHKK